MRSVAASRGVSGFPVVVDHNPARSVALAEEAAGLGGRYLWNPTNPGFAAGANAGIRTVMGRGSVELLVLLNPDVRLEPHCLEQLEEVCRTDPSTGVAGPGLLSEREPETWWNAGSEIIWPSAKPRSLLAGRPRHEARPEILDTGFVCGSVMAFRPAILEKTGLLREDYFLYFEDADFSFRARAAGFRTVVCRGALAWHLGAGSSSGLEAEVAYYRVRNRLRFSRAWNPFPFRGRLHRFFFGLRVGVRAIGSYLLCFRGEELLPVRAVVDGLRGRAGHRGGAAG